MNSRISLDRPCLGELTNEHFAGVSRHLEKTVKEKGCEEAISHRLFTVMVTDSTEFRLAEAIDRFSRLGDARREADMERDRMYQTLKKQLQVHVSLKGERGTAANELLTSIDRLNINTKLPYTQQSQGMQKLIDELDTPRNKALIEMLSLEDLVESLRSAHLAFETLVVAKVSTISAIRDARSINEKRDKADASVRNFLRTVYSNRDLPEWRPLFLACDEYINDEITTNRLRRANARKKKEGN